MKRFLAVAVIFSLLTLSACSQVNIDSEKEAKIAYSAFLKEETDHEKSFCFKDLDNDGIDELLLKKEMELTVYTFDGKVKEIGSHDFASATTRFLSSDQAEYPGMFYCYVGGGKDHYGYMTIEDGALSFEELWTENYADYPVGSPERITEISTDKKLIEASKTAYEKENDLYFSSWETNE